MSRNKNTLQPSRHSQVIREVARIMKRRKEIKLSALNAELQRRLDCKLRADYLVCNLMGQQGYVIDCEGYVANEVRLMIFLSISSIPFLLLSISLWLYSRLILMLPCPLPAILSTIPIPF